MYFKAVYGGRTSPVPVTPSWSETEGGLFNSKSNLLFNYKSLYFLIIKLMQAFYNNIKII